MSEQINDGGPAFPIGDEHWLDDHGERTTPRYPGMSLRDWFAGQAMSPMLLQAYGNTPEILATRAYVIADALLAARSKPLTNL